MRFLTKPFSNKTFSEHVRTAMTTTAPNSIEPSTKHCEALKGAFEGCKRLKLRRTSGSYTLLDRYSGFRVQGFGFRA